MDVNKAYDNVECQILHDILTEPSSSNRVINWIMIMVRTILYQYKVNNMVSNIVQAKRGLRQGDSLAPLLFVSRLLTKMARNPNFNHHLKSEKLIIVNLCFVDDLLLLMHGVTGSVKLVKDIVNNFLSYLSVQALIYMN